MRPPPMPPPGPRGLPFLGVLLALRRDPTGVFLDAALRYGHVVRLRIGAQHAYLITNPADIRHVLQDNARNYHKSPLYDRLRQQLGNGLLVSEDDFWLRQRRIAQPAFQRHRVAQLAEVMADAARGVAAEWRTLASGSAAVDVDEEMMRLTRTVVLRTLLGGDLGPFATKVDAAWAIVNQHIGDSFWSFGLTERLPTPKNRRFQAARAVLRGAVEYVIWTTLSNHQGFSQFSSPRRSRDVELCSLLKTLIDCLFPGALRFPSLPPDVSVASDRAGARRGLSIH